MTALPEVSIIVPVFNEQDNVAELAEDLARIMKESGASHEVIFIDDGSTDKTVDRLQDVQKHCPETRVIQFRRNFGQTAAMAAGFEHARGRVIVPMDGDLQNDPADIPLLLNKLSEGYDVVSGWRRNRQDKVLTRKIPSWIANYLIGKITGVNLHDYGCTLKAYRKDVVEHIRLYGEMHRFIPALASWSGANVTELEVNHRPRVHGRTKYGLGRTIRVILDLITVKFLGTFSTKPLHIFGGIGLLVFLGAFLLGCVVIYQKISSNFSINRNPLFTLTAVLGLMSIQFLLMGLLAEMMARTYHESQNKPTYVIRQIFEPNDMKSTAVGDAEDG